MKPRTTVAYVARHGSTKLNGSNCFRGRIDVDLDAEGRRDANRLAFYFEPIEICEIVSSDRKRAEQTANIVAQKKGMEVYTTPSIRAWNVGDFSGKEKTEEAVAEFEQYVQNPRLQVPGGESLNEFKGRVRPAIEEALKIGIREGKPIFLLGHSSIIHEISDMLTGHHEAVLVEPGGAIEIFLTEDGLSCEAIFKPREAPPRSGADTVS